MEEKRQFRIEKFSCELSDKKDIEEFCCVNKGDSSRDPYDETLFVTEDFEKAKAELEKYESEVYKVDRKYYVTEYYIVEYVYDEDEEDYVFIDFWDCSKMDFGGDEE